MNGGNEWMEMDVGMYDGAYRVRREGEMENG